MGKFKEMLIEQQEREMGKIIRNVKSSLKGLNVLTDKRHADRACAIISQKSTELVNQSKIACLDLDYIQKEVKRDIGFIPDARIKYSLAGE